MASSKVIGEAVFSRQYIHRIVVSVAERAKIRKRVSPHTLRHTFATNMLRAEARVEDVQKMLGHSKIETTLIYICTSRATIYTAGTTSLQG
jgi:site-specific recombinase XerD